MSMDETLEGLRKKEFPEEYTHFLNCQLEGDLHKKNNLLNIVWLCLERSVSKNVTLTFRCITLSST